MAIPATDILRQIRGGVVVDELTEALAIVTAAVRATRKAGEVTLKIKVKPDKGGGRAYVLAGAVDCKTPKRELPEGVFFLNDDGDLVRNDPDQPELRFSEAGRDRPYTPPPAAKSG